MRRQSMAFLAMAVSGILIFEFFQAREGFSQEVSTTELGDIATSKDMRDRAKERRDINTVRELVLALSSCWAPPSLDKAYQGMTVTVLFGLRANGEILAAPRVTFTTEGVSKETREAYLDAIFSTFKDCFPLPLSIGLGGAIAGQPLSVQFSDRRKMSRSASVER